MSCAVCGTDTKDYKCYPCVVSGKQTEREQREGEYVKAGGVSCLYCGSTDIEGGHFDCDGSEVWQEVTCNICEKEWVDVYILHHVEEKE